MRVYHPLYLDHMLTVKLICAGITQDLPELCSSLGAKDDCEHGERRNTTTLTLDEHPAGYQQTCLFTQSKNHLSFTTFHTM